MRGRTFDAWWPRIARVISFGGGMYIMVHAAGVKSESPWLYAAAIGMMGLPTAGIVEKIIYWLSALASPPPPDRDDRKRD